jgi:Tol biopolymer transport system component
LLSCGGGSDVGPGDEETLRLTIVPRDDWTGVVGRPFAPGLGVKVETEDGAARSGVEVAFAVEGGDATLSSGHAVTDEAGVASVGLTLGERAGNVTVVASGDGLKGSPAAFHLTAEPDAPAAATAAGGDSQTGFIGRPFHDTLSTLVTDRFGNPVPGVAVEWSIQAGGGSVSPIDPVTDREGVASATWTAGATPGENQLIASAAVGLSVSFAAKGVPTGGGRLVITPWGPGPVQGLHLLNPDGTGLTPLPNAPGYNGMWSPDGSRIAFNGPTGIINADGSGLTLLSLGGTTTEITAWSPDGTKLLGVSDVDLGDQGQLYIYNADGSGTRQLIPNTVSAYSGSWSPDGSKVLFSSSDPEGIFVIDIDGGGKHRLASGDEATWSPDGSRIVFNGYAPGGGWRPMFMNTDGTDQVPIPGLPDPPGAYSIVFTGWSPDGSRLLLRGSPAPNEDEELYSVNPDGTDLVRITYDDIWLNGASWGP